MNPHPQPAVNSLLKFDFQPRTRVLSGINTIEQIGEITRALPARRVLLVTDPGLVAAGHAAHVQGFLEQSGLAVSVFADVQENPTTHCVDKCLNMARAAKIEAFVALGGGSAMDTAKGCNFLLTNGGQMKDYWGVGKATQTMLPMVAIPTTAGTGSEMQSAALIADVETHQKMACLDVKATARVAILDPVLTLSQPHRVTACTGLDTIVHAVETAVTRKRNVMSMMYSREAFGLAVVAFPMVLREPQNLEARGQMLLAAAWAGVAIELSMLGAAHAAANPLTARHGIVHGHAVGLMLPHVVRFNAHDSSAAASYAELARAAGFCSHGESVATAVETLVGHLQKLLKLSGMPVTLAEIDVKHSNISILSAEAAHQWTANFNPRTLTETDFELLYRTAMSNLG